MTANGSDSAKIWGLLAEFATPQDLVRAAARVRDAGFTKWDAHTPFPVHGLDGAMGIKMTRLPYLVLAAGMIGTTTGLVMQYWRVWTQTIHHFGFHESLWGMWYGLQFKNWTLLQVTFKVLFTMFIYIDIRCTA